MAVKGTILKMNFNKNCPSCNKIMSYSTKTNLTRSIRKNQKCKSCTWMGHKHSKETREKISRIQKGVPRGRPTEEHRKNLSIARGGTGKLNQKWIGHRSWADKVKKRDNYVCQHCLLDGLPSEVDAHHIVPKAKFPQYSTDLDNGQTLCKDCHKVEHCKKPSGAHYGC